MSHVPHMGYISTRKARLRNQLTQVQASLDNLYSIMTEMASKGLRSYTFDSGEGSQKGTRRDLSEIQDMISKLEATERHIINELYNMGLVSVQLRRKNNNVTYW